MNKGIPNSSSPKFVSSNCINPCRNGKKLLVLDIDRTLLDHRSTENSPSEITERPNLHEFLSAAYVQYDIMMWSATSMEFIKMKLQELGVLCHPNYKITALLDEMAMSTVWSEAREMIVSCKPLSLIWENFPEFYNNKNTIMVDDLRRNFAKNPQNGLKIKPFKKSLASHDQELVKLTRYLITIADKDDFSLLDHKKWKSFTDNNFINRNIEALTLPPTAEVDDID